jgi:large subunit ribosomal protein L2
MAVKTFKPITPGRRQMTVLGNETLTTSQPEKKLLKPLKKKGGRNNQGRITARNRGGGHRQKYREIDFKIDKLNIPATVKTIEYDPNRSANIAMICYQDGTKRYIIAPQNITIGDEIIAAEKTELKIGNRLQIKHIPTGYDIHNIEIKPGKGGQIVRSAGTAGQVIGHDKGLIQVKIPSHAVLLLAGECMATIGTVSNFDHANVTIGKAGRQRWLGNRPKVRGKAKNPVDHPHGGGEGRSPIGMKYAKTPWGAHALGVRTRKVKKYSNSRIVKTRRKK